MSDRKFTLQITDHPAVLARVVAVCHQRQCEITALSFRATDRHRAGELVLSVRAGDYAAHRLSHWLLRLVDVEAVRALDEPWREAPPAHAGDYAVA